MSDGAASPQRFAVHSMRLHIRQMSPKDVANAVTLVASSPFDRQRYGSMLDHLSLAWLRLLHYRSMDSIVIEDLDAPRGGILGIGVSVFIANEFLRLCKTAPLFWIGPELVRRTLRGDSVVLAPKALLAANSGDGVNVFTWAGHSREIPETEIPQFSAKITGAFSQQHVGFQIREVSSAGESHPDALAEPYVNVSAHTAPARELRRAPICQCANNPGSRREIRATQWVARRKWPRSFLYFRQAQRARDRSSCRIGG
jgi:hypothetical protein